MQTTNILSIDPGEKYYGFAVYVGTTIHPLESKQFRDVFMLVEYILELQRQYHIASVLVGDGGEPRKPYISKLIRSLQRKGIDVVMFSEYLTSFQGGLAQDSSSYKNGNDHSAAAEEMLREYVEIGRDKIAG